ncbi:MAG: efflux RND transporter periplasmic adaptor subunit [Candidatus Marinimicrobia bacterium]|nr:efflux RND transporter periplasmic adaptor subunit [Candidatus Neomarinimicrobiota bacterium]
MKKLFIPIIFLFAIGCQSDNKPAESESTKDAPAIPVRIATLEYSEFRENINVIGKTETVRRGNIIFEVPGKVNQINVEENDKVSAGTVLAQLDDEQYQAGFTLAKSAVVKARLDFENAQTLFETNVISREQYDMAQIGLNNAEAGFIQARKAMENTAIKAPFDGTIIDKNLEIGDVVAPVAGLAPPFAIADMSEVKIIVSVPESRIGFLHEGQLAEVHIKSLPNKIFNGKVHRVGLATQRLTNSFEVEIRLENTDGLLKLGMVADITIIVNQWDEALVIPISVIHQDKTGPYLYAAKEGKAELRRIEILSLNGINARISGEIAKGDILITHGHHDVRNGSRLSVVGG